MIMLLHIQREKYTKILRFSHKKHIRSVFSLKMDKIFVRFRFLQRLFKLFPMHYLFNGKFIMLSIKKDHFN